MEPLLPDSQQPPDCRARYLLALPSPSRGPGPPRSPCPGRAVHGAAMGMAAGGRRRRPLRYQSLAALVEDSQWPFLFLVSDFSYGADDYDGEGNEEQKGPPEGSETMPYIDESPTMSPQLSARSQGGGDSTSPTPPEGLAPGVGTPTFPSGFGKLGLWGRDVGRHHCPGPGSAWGAAGGQGNWVPVALGTLIISFLSWAPLRLGSPPPAATCRLCTSPCLCSQPSAHPASWAPSPHFQLPPPAPL